MKNKKILSTITNTFLLLVLVGIAISTFYFINIINATPDLTISKVDKKISSIVYDSNEQLIKQLSIEDYKDVTYDMLPDVFINALISCEDVRFFLHDGIDLPRILSALKNDLISLSLKEGASTITQQLIKNMMLTSTKTIERKIQEVYLANKTEKLYSKKEILEFYCNYVCFDGVNHGVESACHKYFNKSVSHLTLPEAALLVGVVNAPSAYSPILNPDKANERKNIVLLTMYNNGFISKNEYENAKKIDVKDMIKQKVKKDEDYKYQAYIDIAYKQIYEKTGYDPYLTPMEIHTYMDTTLQKKIDEISNDTSYFLNDMQQFASTIIDNNNGAIIGVFGKRNYEGQKLLNYAYDTLIQPASTIKILLSYALAFQYLNYSNMETLLDEQTYYPGTDILINNVDKTYLGYISLAEAVGYSRNTTAISTLEKIIDKIGIENVIKYLKDINIMDEGTFSYSYGLGGYTYGVSVTNLAAAYSMIARSGLYIEPLCVKSIKLLDGSNKTITFTPYQRKVLSDSTCYLLIDVLNQVMNQNYWSISDCKPKNINVYAKTGTTSFSKESIKKYNIPENASKDRWLASFTKDYTITCWSGFDTLIKDKKTYFSKSDKAANIVKTFSKDIYSLIAKKNQSFTMPDDLVKVKIVKGSNLLATNQVNKEYIIEALYKKEAVPTTYFMEPTINYYPLFDYFIYKDEINFIFDNIKEENKTSINYEQILGGLNIYIDIYENGNYIDTIKGEKIMTIPLKKNSHYKFDIYYKYQNGFLDGVKNSVSFIYN